MSDQPIRAMVPIVPLTAVDAADAPALREALDRAIGGDKRDACGCHKGCTVTPHDCAVPCRWPACLTEDEARELADEVGRDLLGDHPTRR